MKKWRDRQLNEDRRKQQKELARQISPRPKKGPNFSSRLGHRASSAAGKAPVPSGRNSICGGASSNRAGTGTHPKRDSSVTLSEAQSVQPRAENRGDKNSSVRYGSA